MGDANCVHHLIPIAQSAQVSLVRVVRPEPRPTGLPVSGFLYVEAKGRSRVAQVVSTALMAFREARRPEVHGVVSFNGVPYGVIAVLAGLVARKPVHVGFVGTEAYNLGRNRWIGLLDRLLRRAQLITVPGPIMGDALVARNYDAGRIQVLPHSIDTDSFRPPSEDSERDIDVLFVGALIERKQVDRLVAAIPDVTASRGPTSVCIVGDGQARSSLEDQVERLQLGSSIEFVGYQASPAAWFRRSRAIVISSWWEGFPFVLVEAMCSGAVPVSTKVGSIPDIIDHGHNGLLLDSDQPATIAACLLELLGDEGLEARLRRGALASRSRFSYAAAASLWTEWLRRFE